MYHGGHQAQYAAGFLEALDGCPILIETVEDFRMNGIAALHALKIVHFLGFRGEIGVVFLIHVAEGLANSISPCFVLAIQE